MQISKIYILNYKCFNEITIDFKTGLNILVGDNETGKSTVLEATNLALSGILNARYLRNELSQHLFNHQTVEDYVNSLSTSDKQAPPQISIEVFFRDDYALFEGNGNSAKAKACGVVLRVEFDPAYESEYSALVESGEVNAIPIEYYRITWKSFAREAITGRSIPIKSVLIDSSSSKYQHGSDVYISRIIRDELEDADKVGLSQAYRKMKEAFNEQQAIKDLNDKINSKSAVSDKDLHVSVDLASQHAWQTVLMTYLDKTPFHQIGKGEQSVIKTNLALGHRKTQEANLILLEEPENHLSHTKLNILMKKISNHCVDKQLIVATHSSFVANKLGLENLILLNNQNTTRFADLTADTYTFFKKLPGYQTLRLLLCRKAVLVEGDSDELIFQKAYAKHNDGKLPVEDGIDVIAVKLTFKRFLEIARRVEQPVAVITDNDKDFKKNITEKYAKFKKVGCIQIFADNRETLNTLEPQFVDANKKNLETLRSILGLEPKHRTQEQISTYMENNKTKWALKVFESDKEVNYPKYIEDAVHWCNA